MIRCVVFLVVTLLAAPALAAASDWQELGPGVRARLIAAGTVDNGKMLAGLELDMPQSTNTYWRTPGETGIPTILDFASSSGIAAAEIHWPFPMIDETKGYRDYVYRGATVIPFELTLGNGDAVLEAKATMGVCEELCVPVMTSFTLPLDRSPDPAQAIRLKQAMALAPIDWREEANAVGSVSLSSSGAGLDLHNPALGIDPSQFIVDAADPSLLFGAPQKSPDSAIWTLPLLGRAGAHELVGQTIQLTFLTASGAYTATAVVDPATD